MLFIENTKFRGRYYSVDTKVIRVLPWRDTIEEVKIDLGIIIPEPAPRIPGVKPVPEIRIQRDQNAGEYIENERGFVAIPSRV